MSSLKTNDKNILKRLFSMESGYVLNFTDRTIVEFFERDLCISFYSEKYSGYGNSKGKILRCILDVEGDEIVSKIILTLIAYIENEILLNNLNQDDYSDEITAQGKIIADKLTKNIDFIDKFQFNEHHINDEWRKAISRQNDNDVEGAITIARTLIESVLKYILDDKSVKYDSNTNLPKLYKEVQKILNLAPENHQEQIFKEILSGISKIVNGLGNLRNKLGDSHGKSTKAIKPKNRHSELAVNLSGAMAIFLYKTYQAMV